VTDPWSPRLDVLVGCSDARPDWAIVGGEFVRRADPARHVVVVHGRRGRREVLWDCDLPCPWDLRKVIQAHNRREAER